MMKHGLLFLVLLVLVDAPVAQQPPLTRTTTGVVIDVTVLDRGGRPVLDLTPDEFELAEDGKRQFILSSSLVHAGVLRRLDGTALVASSAAQPQPGSNTDNPPGTAVSPPDRALSVTAILFDRLSPEMRPLAHKAAVTYLATLSPLHDYAGVFLADVKLATFAGFTNNSQVLRAAVDRFGSTAPTNTSVSGTGRGGTGPIQQHAAHEATSRQVTTAACRR